jgi:hypothetical protein
MFITARDDGSVVLARNPLPEKSTFVLKPVEMSAAEENGSPSRTQPTPPAAVAIEGSPASSPKPDAAAERTSAPPVSLPAEPTSPAARRTAQVRDALLGYHWAWMKIGDPKPPLSVDFTRDGHVSGGWTWSLIYKPDGETLVDCKWGTNGHQYLRMNPACDAFDAFDDAANFSIKGKRLAPIDQPVNPAELAALRAEAAPAVAANAVPPSKQIEPLLEPCLDAILAPLETNPQMPRVPVEKLRASLGAGVVTARTPQEKQIYQYALAVCDALTKGMDERAEARATAIASGTLPSVSNGASIVISSGRGSGGAGEAIRKKQMDERNYADKKASGVSKFTESSFYKSWVARSATSRENVMALYGKLVQLEAADPAFNSR